MPRLSQFFVRSALLYFALGFTIGGLMLASKAGMVTPLVWVWLGAHHVLLVSGWLIQLAMGVAYWIFPRIELAQRGRTRMAWASFITLQIGLGLAALSLLQLWWPDAWQLLVPGVMMQTLAVLLFVAHAWPRVRAAFVRAEQIQTS